MRINHNISALKANNQLGKTNSALDSSLQKLSSGYRINSAADDSAGLAISEKMRTQIAGLDQASRNASDGISVIQTAEGALIEVEAMLQRMRELSVQSANGTYTADDRVAIQSEIDQLSQEIQRISDTTEFNTMKLLNGNIDRKSYSSNSNVKLISLSDTVSFGDYSIEITRDARQAVVVGGTVGIPATETAVSAKFTDKQAGTININGESVTIKEGDSYDEVFTKLRDVCDSVGVNVFASTTTTPSMTDDLDSAGYANVSLAHDTHLVFVSNEYGSKEKIELYCDNPFLSSALGLTNAKVTAFGYDAKATISDGFNSTATVSISGNKVTITDRKNFSMVFEVEPGTVGSSYSDVTIAPSGTGTSVIPGYIVTQDARQAVIVGNTTAFADVTDTLGAAETVTINGTTLSFADTATIQDVYDEIKTYCDANGIKFGTIAEDAVPSIDLDLDMAGYTSDADLISGERLLFVSDDYGSAESISISCSAGLFSILGLTSTTSTTVGVDAKIELSSKTTSDVTYTVSGNSITFSNKDGLLGTTTVIKGAADTIYTDPTITDDTTLGIGSSDIERSKVSISVLDAGQMDLQIGANEGQTMSITIPKVNPSTLGIDKINIGTADGAQAAITLLDNAINTVSSIRSKLGAYQNRLEHSISNLDTTSENMTESLSRISDVDMAEEMAQYTQMNVLAQAGTSMLAQANQRPQTILSLLQQ